MTDPLGPDGGGPGRLPRSGSATGSGRPARLGSTTGPLVSEHRLVLFDLDGTLYVGPDAVPGAAGVLEQVVASGARCAFVTNNASRAAVDIAVQLAGLGIPCSAEEVVTSAQAVAETLRRRLPIGAAVLVVGGDGLRSALSAVGLRPVSSLDDGPLAVAQGFAPTVGWAQLTEGALGVRQGLPWVVSNTDLTLPTPRGLAPGNGALVQVIRVSTGAVPEVVGKPERPLLDLALGRFGADTGLVVGDRLDTDIACAVTAGLPSLVVLTGVADAAQVLCAAPAQRPTFVSPGLEGLLMVHREVSDAPDTDGSGGSACAGWRAWVSAGVLRLEGEGTATEALRACATASWAAADAAGSAPDVSAVARMLAGLIGPA